MSVRIQLSEADHRIVDLSNSRDSSPRNEMKNLPNPQLYSSHKTRIIRDG